MASQKPAAPKPGTWEALNQETLSTDFNQWPNLALSSYGPVREQVSIISGIDTSPEELHCHALDELISAGRIQNFYSNLQGEVEKASFSLSQIRSQNPQSIIQQLQSSRLDHVALGSSLPDIPLGPHSAKKQSSFNSANVGFMKPGYVPGSFGNPFEILNRPELQLGADAPKNFTQPTKLFGSDSQLMKDGPKTFGQFGSTPSQPAFATSQPIPSQPQPAFAAPQSVASHPPSFGDSNALKTSSSASAAPAFGGFSGSNIGFGSKTTSSFSGFGQASSNTSAPNIGFGKSSFPASTASNVGFGQSSNATHVSSSTGFSFAAGLKALGKMPSDSKPQDAAKPPSFPTSASQSTPQEPEKLSFSNLSFDSAKPKETNSGFKFSATSPFGQSKESKSTSSESNPGIFSNKSENQSSVDPSKPQANQTPKASEDKAPSFSFKSALSSFGSNASGPTASKTVPTNNSTPSTTTSDKKPSSESSGFTKTFTTEHGTASFRRVSSNIPDKPVNTASQTSDIPKSTSQSASDQSTSVPTLSSEETELINELKRFHTYENEFSDLSLDALVGKLDTLMDTLHIAPDFKSHPVEELPLPSSFPTANISIKDHPEFAGLPPFPPSRDPKNSVNNLGSYSAYSAPGSLEPWELEAFKCSDFVHGTIPSRPPTLDLLFRK